MNDNLPTSNTPDQPAIEKATSPSPLSCFLGTIVAGGIAIVLYVMTISIAQSFAAKGIHSDNLTVQRITIAVRTLVIGLSALATGIFGLASLGLFGLGVQLLIQRLPTNSSST